MKKVSLQPAYILHRRAYRETSFLIEFFTAEYGRVSVIAKGVRKSRSVAQAVLQPFVPLWISWAGRGELVTLTGFEVNGAEKRLVGRALFAGFYINELLMLLLQNNDPHSFIFASYEKIVDELQIGLDQKYLRQFEKALLEELGYGVLHKSDVSLQQQLIEHAYYLFLPGEGFTPLAVMPEVRRHDVFSGKSLLAVARERWEEEETLQAAKRLTQCVLKSLLGSRPLHSRKLFLQLERESIHEE